MEQSSGSWMCSLVSARLENIFYTLKCMWRHEGVREGISHQSKKKISANIITPFNGFIHIHVYSTCAYTTADTPIHHIREKGAETSAERW